MQLALQTFLLFSSLYTTWAFAITLIRDIIRVKGRGDPFYALICFFCWSMFYLACNV